MKRQPMGPILGPWFKGMDETPPNAQECAREVMARLPEVRQRGRWWPLPTFERHAPIPATNGPMPVRGFTMFSALKFMVASVIVALVGGFLLTGILTSPQSDDVLPAAVTASPTTEATSERGEPPTTAVRTDILPGVELTVEEVEPGVFHVLNDGVRNLPIDGSMTHGSTVIAGLDGTVWLKTAREAFRLGDEVTISVGGDAAPEPDSYNPVDVVVAPDGTLWNRNRWGKGLFAFDGDGWQVMRPDKWFHALTMGSDGRIWAVWTGPRAKRGRVGRVDGEWEVITDAPIGYPERMANGGLTVSDDGHIWLYPVDTWTQGFLREPKVYRHDGETWRSVDLPGRDTGHLVVGQDGTVWWAAMRDQSYRVSALHQLDGDDWQRFAATDDWPESIHSGDKRLDVAPDGRLWVFAVTGIQQSGPDCAARFNGDGWTTYLEACLAGDLAPDGSAWVLTRSGLYVITSQAVAATG